VRRALFVPNLDEFDFRVYQRIEKRDRGAAGQAEDQLDILLFQATD
jgi:hypothetical protein